MSKKLMLITAALFGFSVCASAQAPVTGGDPSTEKKMEQPAAAKAHKAKKGKKIAKRKLKKEKAGGMAMPGNPPAEAPAAAPTK